MNKVDIKQAAAALLGASVLLVSPTHAQCLEFSGDFRLRFENTINQEPGPNLDARNREVVRFRAGLNKAINKWIDFGARVATGSQNDPNTADVTLGSFVDDLDVSLDRAFMRFRHGNFVASGGKFANPFRRTDLVWDGDVNPQGVAGSYKFSGSDRVSLKGTGMYSIVDEHANSATPDSDMWGAQGELAFRANSDLKLALAGGYYDYHIASLSNADAGDTRSNVLNEDGTAYVSDFDLLNFIGAVEHRGFNERFPIKVVGDYVKNLGANVAGDQGFSVDVFLGKASQQNDTRFRYGYSETETDAVLAAFSNDNTTIATNYKQHTMTVDYVALDNTALNVTWYLYKLKDPRGADDEFVSRLRLNAVVKF